MEFFIVSVEKRAYKTGCIEIEAKDAEDAITKVDSMMNSDELTLNDSRISWNSDWDFEDGTFTTTGDVE